MCETEKKSYSKLQILILLADKIKLLYFENIFLRQSSGILFSLLSFYPIPRPRSRVPVRRHILVINSSQFKTNVATKDFTFFTINCVKYRQLKCVEKKATWSLSISWYVYTWYPDVVKIRSYISNKLGICNFFSCRSGSKKLRDYLFEH